MKNRGLVVARLEVCRGCTGYMLTPLLENCACRHCGEAGGLPTQQINMPPDQPFLDGLESNCPLGLWAGVKEKDPTQVIADEKASLERTAQRRIRAIQPLLARIETSGGVTDVEKVNAAFDEMEAVGAMDAVLRAEIERQLEEPVGAKL